MSKKKSHYSKAGLVFEELEPRLLLSADPLAVATDVNVAAVQELVLGDNEDQTAIVQVDVEQSFSSVRNELVIIDSRAPNYQQLHNDLIKAQQQGRNIHVVVLDAHRDGIDQINEALASHHKLDAVHIVSHGDDGQLQLGATQLNKSTLRDHAADISSWKDTFSDDGDLLIYGCNLAESSDGKSLVDALSYLTATDVAASDDLTGNQLLGGDWELEYNAGDIETDIAFSDDVQQNWQGTLDGAAQAAAEEQKADAEEQQQQEQQTQLKLTEQQAALVEKEQAASKQDEEEQQAAITEEQRREIVFIDESVDDFQAFIDDLNNNSNSSIQFETVMLDNERDGIQQISETLSAFRDIDAVHILSHGNDGAVKLGSTWLQSTNLADYSDSIKKWDSSLDHNADILIYGCNLAESESGESFVNQLAVLTNADVAASDDITGSVLLAGDWDLEYENGSIETNIVVSGSLQVSWQHQLAVETVRDQFDAVSYNNNDGTTVWTGDWIETADDGLAVTGDIRVESGELHIDDVGDGGSGGGSVSRAFDLSGASTATLTFDYNGFGSGGLDTVAVEVSSNGGSSWTLLENIDVVGALSGSKTYTLESFVSLTNNMELRYNIATGFGGAGQYFKVDNVQIQYPGVNSAPVAVNDTVNITEDTPTIIDLVGNDTDPEGDTLTVLDITTPANGAVVNNGDGTVTYTPNTNYNGSDTFDYVVTDSNDGRAHYWNLDGDADDAIGGNHGTLNGGPTTVAGQIGNGLSFDEVDDHVVIPDVTYGDEFTLSLQFKIDDNSGSNYQYMYSHGAFGTQNSLNVLIGEAGAGGADANELIVRFVDANDPTGNMGLNWDISGLVGDGQWHMFTMSVETGVGTTFYLDGAVHTTHPNGGDAFNPTGDVYLGAREDLDSNRYYGGLLDSVQIHDRTLNAAEIIDLHTGGTSVATVNITVTSVNDAPLATNLSAAEAYTEDTALNLTDIVVSDVDSANATVTLTLSDVAAGTLNTATSGAVTSTFAGGVWTASGAIADVNTLLAGVTFTPSLNYDSNFSIATSVDDGVAPAITGSKAMTATVVNDVPVATTNTVTTTEDNAYNFTAADFTFIDVEGDSIVSATIINQSLSGGTLIHSGGTTVNNGDTLTAAQLDTLVYTPTANTTGSPLATFDFSVNDAGVGVVIAQMRIDVIAVNDVPVATANTVTTTEDNAYNFAASDFTFTDTEGDALVSATISNLSLVGGTLTHSGGTAVNGGDTLTAAQLDTLIYTPVANANATPLATFDFTVNDAGAGTVVAQMDIDVTAVNDVPIATVNTVTTTEDNAYSFSSADFTFSDVEGNVLVSARITNLSLAGGTLTYSGGIAVSDGDTLAAAQLDTLIYTPAANTSGSPLATFDFTVNDAGAGVVTAQMDIDVTAVNDVPVATANTVTTTEDNAYNFAASDFTFNDTEADALVSSTITNLSLAGGTLRHSGGITVNNGDTLTAAQLNTLVYIPTANTTGSPLATFDFTVNDAGAGIVTAQMDIDVSAVNDVPVATANTVTTSEDNAYIFTVADFTFTDTEGDSLVSATITNLALAGGTLTHSGGTVVNNGDTLTAVQLDTLIYSPAANANGLPLATFDFTVNDAGAGVVPAQMDIDVTAVNDAPVAAVDNFTIIEGSTTVLDLALNDTDVDDGLDLNSIVITGAPVSGSLVINGDGTVTYTHNGSETLSDSFSYTISDISGSVSNTAIVNITVTPVNDAPVAVDDSATVDEGNSILIDLAANDTDVDNVLDLNSINIIGTPANGSLLINGDGTVTYTHDGSNTASDSFTYTIFDVSGGISNTATVNITVTSVNDAPTTSGITDVTVNEDSVATSIDLNAAFDDADNLDTELMYSIVGNNNIGLFTGVGVDGSTGQLTLDYAADMNGSAQISIRATDPSGLSVDTLFTVTVNPVNDNPVLQANTGMMATGTTPATISSGELNVTDIDNLDTELVYSITILPSNGELLLNGIVLAVNDTFTQAELDSNLVVYRIIGTGAADQFGFTVSDTAGGTLVNNTFDIVVQLSPDNDDDAPENETPPNDDTDDGETSQEEIIETGTGGSTEGAGGYGGGFEPLGSSSIPPATAPVLSIDPSPAPVQEQIQPVEKEDHIVSEINEYNVATFTASQLKSVDALWTAIDKMKQEMGDAANNKANAVQIKIAAAETTGVVLTAGVVAWILRSGALLSSLMSTIPLWKGYDPLPILAYKDDEEEKEDDIHEDRIPTSLEELKKLKKLIKQKEKQAEKADIEILFGNSATRE